MLALKREGYRKTDSNLKDAVETAVFPGFWRMAAKYWRSGMGEYYRSLNKQAFTRALRKLVPEIQLSKQMIHVCNVPSPAATASLIIGRQIAEMVEM